MNKTLAAALLLCLISGGANGAVRPVIDAAARGDIDTVRQLLREGADANEAQGDGMTALHSAGERGSFGHLWLWMDELRARYFHSRAFELAEHRGIERVSMIYQPWGQEIAEVEFQGSPASQLDSSIARCERFWRS